MTIKSYPLLLILLGFGCRAPESKRLANYYNKKICRNYQMGSKFNTCLKYMLDTVFLNQSIESIGDTNYCLFESSLFTSKVYFRAFNSVDTIYYKFEFDQSSQSRRAIWLDGIRIRRARYVIQQIDNSKYKIEDSHVYRSFINKEMNYTLDTINNDGSMEYLALRYWKKKNKKFGFEFYRFYLDSLIKEPNKPYIDKRMKKRRIRYLK